MQGNVVAQWRPEIVDTVGEYSRLAGGSNISAARMPSAFIEYTNRGSTFGIKMGSARGKKRPAASGALLVKIVEDLRMPLVDDLGVLAAFRWVRPTQSRLSSCPTYFA